MKKNIHSKSTLVFFLCLALHLSTHAQVHKYFIVTGKVVSDSEIIENGTIQISKNDNPAVVVQLSEHGRFRLELDYNAEFKLIFSQKGYLSKKINVNTEIPKEVMDQQGNLSHFLMAVRLFKTIDEIANLLPVNQIQQIKYFPQLNNFGRMSTIFDQEYVENGKLPQNQSAQMADSKPKMQIYQTF